MITKCDKCEELFETHDGGQICVNCNKTFCPDCEEEYFRDFSGICRECEDKLAALAIVATQELISAC